MANLTQKLVQSYRLPAYPSRLDVLADPDLLRQHVPPAWLSRKEMAGLLGVFLAVNGGGCSKEPSSGPSTRPAGNDLVGKAAIVAPIFEHGDGRGATGCVVVNPPVFLSEEEALQVITEELTQAGLTFSERNARMEGVSIPPRKRESQQDWVSGRRKMSLVPMTEKSKPLALDMKDPVRSVAIEFVSAPDYTSLGGPDSQLTVQSYDFKDVVKWVGKQVSEQGHGLRVALFYDPVTQPAFDATKHRDAVSRWVELGAAEALSKTESKRLLRQQVKDFVDWLKGQGVI